MKPETHATPTAQDIIAELNALGNPDKAARGCPIKTVSK